MTVIEVNFDGLPGPTHNFGGLAAGNLASARSARTRSWPRQAALQSIAKMRSMIEIGLVQGILPPHPRPDINFLRDAGFSGDDESVLARARVEAPELLVAASSASFMWAANAATVSAAQDTADGRVHFTAANLSSQLHRSIEPGYTRRVLQAVFNDQAAFAHHAPLPGALSDEGAANHTRFAPDYDQPGVSLFVYGRSILNPEPSQPRMPARQTLEASQGIVRQHGLDPDRVVFARQHPAAIDAGVFHNDVIAVGNRDLLLVHELAFEAQEDVLRRLSRATGGSLKVVVVPNRTVAIERAVDTYLFNAQLVSLPGSPESQVLVAPVECREDDAVSAFLASLESAGVLDAVHYLDVRQSMRNGGGPACLRLRVILEESQLERLPAGIVASPDVLDELKACVTETYPEHLDPADLADPVRISQSRRALLAVREVLGLSALD